MYPVSRRFLSAIRTGGASRVSYADVYYGGVFLRSLPISEGHVNLDRSSLVWGSGTLIVGDPDLIPKFANSSLAPYAIELKIRSGFTYPDGFQELIPLGIYRLQNTNWTEAGGEIPTIEFMDRFQAIQEAGFLAPVDRAGYTVKSTIATFIKDIYPNCDVSFCDDHGLELALPGGTIFQESRADAIQTCLGILGCEGHFNEVGDYFVRDIPGLTQATPKTDAVYTITTGESGTLADANRGVSRDGVLNGVTVYGATTEAGVQYFGQAFDDDPQSPTYYGPTVPNAAGFVTGPKAPSLFGQATAQVTNDSLTSNAACVIAAKAYLRDHQGLARSLTLTCASNPALRPGDTILIHFLDGTEELHIIDNLSIPLVEGDMTISTRTLTYQYTIGPPDTDGGEQGTDFGNTWSDLLPLYVDWEAVKDTHSDWNDLLVNG